MKILITGASGQVGHDLVRLAHATTHEILPLTHADLDITQFSALDQVFKTFQPELVINLAAYTKVDQAEKEPELAFQVNVVGARYLAVLSAENDNPLFHLSTDYVFDGAQQTPYTEEDVPAPINVYGKTKLEGEEAIQNNCEKHLILRVSSVFGTHGSNFVKTILRLARQQEQLRIVADQVSCPTPAIAIARTLLALAEEHPASWGIYHYCGKPGLSWYEFAEKIVALAATSQSFMAKKIMPIAAEEFQALAKRPRHSVLNCNKIKQVLQIKQPAWDSELQHVISTA